MVFLLCWVAMRLLLQEAIVIQENVVQFKTSLLFEWLGGLYYFEIVQLCPSMLGWPVARSRKWTVMRHRYKTRAFTSPLNVFTKLFYKPFCGSTLYGSDTPSWDCFFVADAAELAEELAWAIGRQESRYSEVMAGVADISDQTAFGVFWASLTQSEQNHLDTYLAGWPGLMYSLNQNPSVTATHSTWKLLHTLIKNAGVIWRLSGILYGKLDLDGCFCKIVFMFALLRS
jgi:hypothetical protein